MPIAHGHECNGRGAAVGRVWRHAHKLSVAEGFSDATAWPLRLLPAEVSRPIDRPMDCAQEGVCWGVRLRACEGV